MDNNEFNKLIQQTENKHRRDNLKAAITRHGGIVKINQTAALADIQSYLLTDSSARHSYTEKLKMQAVMQRITTSIEEDLAARGYTSVFNILLDMAIGDDENQIKLKSHYIDRIEISIAQTYYPQLIGLIESDELLVADKRGMSCKYALLKQAPSEIEIPDFLTMPEAITRFSTKFWQQFNVLKDFFVHFEIEKKTNAKRQRNIENVKLVLDEMRKQKRTIPNFIDHPFSDAAAVMSFAERNSLECPKNDTLVSIMQELLTDQ